MRALILILQVSLLLLCTDNLLFAQRYYLFNYNSGDNNQYIPGWTWYSNVSNTGHQGWLLNEDGPFGGLKHWLWGDGPRKFQKNDDYQDNDNPFDTDAYVLTTVRSPSTNNGGALYVYDTGAVDKYRAAWWLWYDGEGLSNRQVIPSNNINRMSYYFFAHGTPNLETASQSSFPNQTSVLGTYLCWGDGSGDGQGDGCPYEGPGNQHFYFYIGTMPDMWCHVVLDRHPQWLRDAYIPDNDPRYESDGYHFYDVLHQFYLELSGSLPEKSYYYIDEMYFYSTFDMDEEQEPNQNDISISSIWVGFDNSNSKFHIGWEKGEVSSSGWHTYDVRWSIYPITNNNFLQANEIIPDFYGGVEVAGVDGEHLIREPDSYRQPVWTRFSIPQDIINTYNHIYFAVKDVSVEGGHVGSVYPYEGGDLHDAASAYIKTIDYYIRPDGAIANSFNHGSYPSIH